jgi:hypothetical protein
MRVSCLCICAEATTNDTAPGKFTSNVFRLAFQLMVAQSGGGGFSGMRPYVSLDAPWCFDFGYWYGYANEA